MTKNLAGKVLKDRYYLAKRIGGGGQGDVYQVEDLHMNKKILAAKVLRNEGSKPTDRRRFEQEVMLAIECRHPHVVDIHDYDTTPEGLMFFIMEYLDGPTLRELLNMTARPLPWRRVVKMLIQICDALCYAHEKNVIHRDVKPENCMLVRNASMMDHIKILDLGIAKLTNPRQDQERWVVNTRPGVWCTIPYAAPELLRTGTYDHRVDIYALGVMGFELLTGELPFAGGTPFEVAQKHLTEPPPIPSSRLGESPLPRALDELILRALAKHQHHRFRSMRQMGLKLREALELDDLGRAAAPLIVELVKDAEAPATPTDDIVSVTTRAAGVGRVRFPRVIVNQTVLAPVVSGDDVVSVAEMSPPRDTTTTLWVKRTVKKRVSTLEMPKPSDAPDLDAHGAVREFAPTPEPEAAEQRETARGESAALLALLPQAVATLFFSFITTSVAVVLLTRVYANWLPEKLQVRDRSLEEGAAGEVIHSRPPRLARS